MIQRLLYTALKTGLAEIAKDPTILDDIFGSKGMNLAAEEITMIKELFAKRPPDVHHGYARADYQFPLYSITLANESETQHFLNDDAGMLDDYDDPDYGADVHATFWEHNFNILCYAEHPEVAIYIYEVGKNILLAANSAMAEAGVFEPKVSGMDLAPDPRYIPDHLFARQISYYCQDELWRIDKESKLDKAFKVAGIHLDSTGGVKTLVTVIGSEDDNE
jgi:hypothetical protein